MRLGDAQLDGKQPERITGLDVGRADDVIAARTAREALTQDDPLIPAQGQRTSSLPALVTHHARTSLNGRHRGWHMLFDTDPRQR